MVEINKFILSIIELPKIEIVAKLRFVHRPLRWSLTSAQISMRSTEGCHEDGYQLVSS